MYLITLLMFPVYQTDELFIYLRLNVAHKTRKLFKKWQERVTPLHCACYLQ